MYSLDATRSAVQPWGQCSETITKRDVLGEEQRLYQDLSRGIAGALDLIGAWLGVDGFSPTHCIYKIDVMHVHTRDKEHDANLSQKQKEKNR